MTLTARYSFETVSVTGTAAGADAAANAVEMIAEYDYTTLTELSYRRAGSDPARTTTGRVSTTSLLAKATTQ